MALSTPKVTLINSFLEYLYHWNKWINFSVSSVNCHYSLTSGHHSVQTLNSGILLHESQISPYSLKEPVHFLSSSPSFSGDVLGRRRREASHVGCPGSLPFPVPGKCCMCVGCRVCVAISVHQSLWFLHFTPLKNSQNLSTASYGSR